MDVEPVDSSGPSEPKEQGRTFRGPEDIRETLDTRDGDIRRLQTLESHTSRGVTDSVLL